MLKLSPRTFYELIFMCLAVRADASLKVGARLLLRVSIFLARVLCPTGRGGGKSLVLEHKRGCKKIVHLALKHAMGN